MANMSSLDQMLPRQSNVGEDNVNDILSGSSDELAAQYLRTILTTTTQADPPQNKVGILFFALVTMSAFFLYMLCIYCFRRKLNQVRRQIRESLEIGTGLNSDSEKTNEIKMLTHAIEQSRAQYVDSFLSTDTASSALFLEEESVVPVQALPLANDTDTSSLIDVKEQENDDLESLHCSICLEKYKPVDRVSFAKNEQTPCHRHMYHEDCIKIWLMKNDNCPYCRRSYFGV